MDEIVTITKMTVMKFNRPVQQTSGNLEASATLLTEGEDVEQWGVPTDRETTFRGCNRCCCAEGSNAVN